MAKRHPETNLNYLIIFLFGVLCSLPNSSLGQVQVFVTTKDSRNLGVNMNFGYQFENHPIKTDKVRKELLNTLDQKYRFTYLYGLSVTYFPKASGSLNSKHDRTGITLGFDKTISSFSDAEIYTLINLGNNFLYMDTLNVKIKNNSHRIYLGYSDILTTSNEFLKFTFTYGFSFYTAKFNYQYDQKDSVYLDKMFDKKSITQDYPGKLKVTNTEMIHRKNNFEVFINYGAKYELPKIWFFGNIGAYLQPAEKFVLAFLLRAGISKVF